MCNALYKERLEEVNTSPGKRRRILAQDEAIKCDTTSHKPIFGLMDFTFFLI